MIYRRQKKQYLFGGLLGAIAIVNVLFFFILLNPARSEYNNLRESISQLRNDAAARKATITRLEKRNTELDRFEQDRREMFETNFVKRDEGFVKMMPEIEMMGQQTGVRNSHKDWLFETI